MKPVFVVTGVSKGIGYALAKRIAEEDNYIVGISRTEKKLDFLDQQFFVDLSYPEKVLAWLNELILPESGRFYLINNAAMLEPVGLTGSLDNMDLSRSINLNLTTPALLINEFISRYGDKKLSILNISSGASLNIRSGWSAYCTTKAALETFSKAVLLEHPKLKILSVAPGLVNTGMQEEIRAKTTESFPDKNKFVKLYEDNKLSAPEEVAECLYQLILDPTKCGRIDLRD